MSQTENLEIFTAEYSGTAPLLSNKWEIEAARGQKEWQMITTDMLNEATDTNETPQPTVYTDTTIERLLVETTRLICQSESGQQSRLRTKSSLADIQQQQFDTWLLIAKNIYELRELTSNDKLVETSVRNRVYSFVQVCKQLGVQRTKAKRLADNHGRLKDLSSIYQEALRTSRKLATEDVVNDLQVILAEDDGTYSVAQVRERLREARSWAARTCKVAADPAAEALTALVKAFSTKSSHEDQLRYVSSVVEELSRLIGYTAVVDSGVVQLKSLAAEAA